MSRECACVHYDNGKCQKFTDDKSFSWCVEGPCIYSVPSNADRVRAMSDEELAAFLAKFDSHCRVCPADDICGGYSTTPPRDCAYWLEEWLKHPAEEVDDG